MSKRCCYCKQMVDHDFFNHLIECDGTDKLSIKARRASLVNERVKIEGQIAAMKERLSQVLKQIEDIDLNLPGQQAIKF